MVQLRMRGNHMIETGNPSLPQIGRHDGTAHIERVVLRSGIDEHGLPVRQFQHAGVTLPHVQKGHPHGIVAGRVARRPPPPADQKGRSHETAPPPPRAAGFRNRPDRDHEQQVERGHGHDRRRGDVPFSARHPGAQRRDMRHEIGQELTQRCGRKRILAGDQQPDR